jgi:hypothetical protein
MQQPVEECRDCGRVAEELPPIIDGTIRGEERRRAFVTAHDQLEEVFGSRVRELAHTEVIDDQQRHGRQLREVVFARAGERRLGEFFEQRMRLTIDHAIALQDRRTADRLRR